MPDSARRLGAAASGLIGFIAAAVIAGVLVAVAVTPAVALTGVATKQGIGLFEKLPSDLKIVALDQKTQIYAKSHGQDVLLTSFYAQDRDVITWSGVPATVKNATLAGEDVRFYQHGGIDPAAIVRATLSNVLGDDIQGASTITQQYVKNVCVQESERLSTAKQVQAAYDDCTDTSYGRKLREMRLAIGLEKTYSKNDILLGYLNIAGFGGRVYGIEAASQYYYGKSAADLSIGEAASLIAIVNNPEKFRLDEPANIAADTVRRNHILDVELQQRMITKAEHDAAVAAPVKVTITEPKVGCEAAGIAAYFCDAVVRTIQNSSLYGKTTDDREAALESGGWQIHTTLDLDLQKKAQATMATYVPSTVTGWKVAGTGTSVQVGTGRVLTMVQNTHFSSTTKAGNDSVNYNTSAALGDSSGFQPGSTFKLFTLLDWLKTGHTLDESVEGDARTMPASDFTMCGKPFVGDAFTFGNDEDEAGSFSVLYGTARSINGVFATMASQLDLCDIKDLAESMGVRPATGGELTDYPSFVIGQASSVAPLAMAAAYATIANNGVYCAPVLIDSIVKPDGSQLPVPQASCKQVVDKQVAIAAAYALHGVVTGDGTAGLDSTADGLYEFGKTGTNDGNKGTWMIGSTSKVTTAVMVANNGTSQDLRAVYDFPYCPLEQSSQAAIERHCLWKAMQTAANATYGGDTTWPAPESQYLYGGAAATPGAPQTTAGTVPNVVGMSEAQAESTLVGSGFAWAIGSPEASDQASGTVASTEPAAGSAAQPHTEVLIHPSGG